MGDEEHGLVGIGGEKAAVELTFGGLVERAADLVEQEDVTAMQQSAGDGDTLSLTFAESATTFAQFGIETIGQVEHKVGTGSVQYLAQFGVGGVGLSQLQVVADGAAHQGVSLRHETEFPTLLYRSFRRLDKTEDESEQRGLADTSLTHDGGLRTREEVVGEMRQYLPVALGIAERHVFEADALRSGVADM